LVSETPDLVGFPPEGRAAIEDAVASARAVIDRAYAPYSEFRVGAAAVAGGRSFVGVNVENASHPVGVCAERNALAAMVVAGETSLDAVAVVTPTERPTAPCGACRQALWEFGPSSIVVAETVRGDRLVWALTDLLPDAFGPSDLGR
jgi:cytidine deaminase